MSWIFAVIGVVAGGIAALTNDFSVSNGVLLGAVLGYALGRLLQAKEPRTIPTERPTRQPIHDDLNPMSELARLEWLEQEVIVMRSELRQLRGAAAGSPEPETLEVMSRASIHHGSTQAEQALPHAGVPTPPEPLRSEPQYVYVLPASIAVARSVAGTASALKMETTATTTSTELPQPAEPPTQPVPPPAPRQPRIADHLFNAARNWLLGGNTVVRIGIIVLFFGIAFLLKYAADNNMLPIEFRLAGVAIGAVVLLATGWRIGERRGAYGQALQGGGVGVLYLTVFAATKLYSLLPPGAALPLMIAICALSAFLAVRQNASSLAFMGSAGGFLAPVLLSTGGGSHVMLFSYYALLNAGIFAIAWFKSWRPLNLLGFVFTFTIGAAWGVTAYRPELLASTEPFLILFFLMYVGIALLYAVHRELALKYYIDGTLVFGTPIVAIGLQAALVRGTEFGLAWSAVALAAFYLAIASWLARRRTRPGMLFEATLALAVIFATLAVPLAFSGSTTSAAWAIEGAALTWVGVRQRRLAAFGVGLLMQAAAAGAFFAGSLIPSGQPGWLPVLNSACIATVLIAVAGVFTGWQLHGQSEARAWHPWMQQTGLVAAGWGLLWWICGGMNEIVVYAGLHGEAHRIRFEIDACALFAVFTAWLAHLARRRLAWALAEWPALALVPVIALLAIGVYQLGEAPFSGLGVPAWPVAIAGGYWLLWRQQRDVGVRLLASLHTLMFWTLCGLLVLEGYWLLHAYVPEGAWSWSAWAYGCGLLLLLVAGLGGRLRWPVARFVHAYQLWGAAPLAALLWGWSLASIVSDGSAAPLFWLPILNPLDVAQLLAFMGVAVWLRRLTVLGIHWHRRAFDYAVFATLFLWFNGLLLRTLHQRFHTAYDIDAVLASFGLQQVFLIGWSAFAFAGMWLARREGIVRLCAIASTPLVLVMWIWTFYANLTQDGGGWTRLPLFNPLDLSQVVIYAIAALWLVRVSGLGVPLAQYRVPLRIAVGATGFLWLNTMLLRTLHHWADVPYTFDDMGRSTLVQAAVSVFWTACALAMMIWATRRAMRVTWFVGGGLLALTVIKLFLFDLSHVKGIERIVSFIGIGVMLLLIGYFSPLPPRCPEDREIVQ